MRRRAAILAFLLAASAAPGMEVRLRHAGEICPVESVDRWGWRVEVLREAPGQWVVRTVGTDPHLPEPPALRPLVEAAAAVKARLAYAAGIWSEDPEEALLAGRGNCISFTAVLERDLARMGFRTRRVHGLLFGPPDSSNPFYLASAQATPHRWLEVFTAGHGWLPLDPVAPGGRLTAHHLALKGDDTAGWLRNTRIEVLGWD